MKDKNQYVSPLILDFLLSGRTRVCVGEGSIQDYEVEDEQNVDW